MFTLFNRLRVKQLLDLVVAKFAVQCDSEGERLKYAIEYDDLYCSLHIIDQFKKRNNYLPLPFMYSKSSTTISKFAILHKVQVV